MLRRITLDALAPFYDFTLDERCAAAGRQSRDEAQEKLDHCRQILRSMRLELVRFRTGGLNAQPAGLTMVTQQAQAVVREMGYLAEANAELNAL